MGKISLVLLALAVVLFFLAALLPKKLGADVAQSLAIWALFCWSLSQLLLGVERW